MRKTLKEKTEEGYVFKTICYRQSSRWIQIQYKEVTPRHRLWDYSDNGTLCYFRHNGREYALGQFVRLKYCSDNGNINLEDGTQLVAYDCTEHYKPYLLELGRTSDLVRLWTEESTL